MLHSHIWPMAIKMGTVNTELIWVFIMTENWLAVLVYRWLSKLIPSGQVGDWRYRIGARMKHRGLKNPFLRLRETEYTQMSAKISIRLIWKPTKSLRVHSEFMEMLLKSFWVMLFRKMYILESMPLITMCMTDLEGGNGTRLWPRRPVWRLLQEFRDSKEKMEILKRQNHPTIWHGFWLHVGGWRV